MNEPIETVVALGGRFAMLRVSAELIAQWLVRGNPTLAIEGMPADAKVVGGYFEALTAVFLLQSDSFAMLPHGATVPFMDSPTYRRADA